MVLLPKQRKNCSIDWEKLLKFENEGGEFAKNLRSLEQFIETVKGRNNFNRMFFNLFLDISQTYNKLSRTIRIHIGKNIGI